MCGLCKPTNALMGTHLQQPPLMLLYHASRAHSADCLPPCIARLQEEQSPSPAQRRAPGRGIDTLILLDRAVDVVTPCCTQLTYEGLIDEVFGIVNGAVQLEPGRCQGVHLRRSCSTLMRIRCAASDQAGNGIRHSACIYCNVMATAACADPCTWLRRHGVIQLVS